MNRTLPHAVPRLRHGTQAYSAVSMFSGCGGLDLGAELTGHVRTVWANDIDPYSVATYQRNLGAHIIEGDIRDLLPPEVPCDILLAGPPCQDYSTLWNHDGAKTDRGNLYREVVRFLNALRPAAFVLENVPGLLSANRGRAWTEVRRALKEPTRFLSGTPGVRYRITSAVVDLADLGVPQNRERLFVVGARSDLGVQSPNLHSLAVQQRAIYPHVTVGQALDDFPIPEGAPNHELFLDTAEVIQRLELIKPGENYEAIPPEHALAVRGLISHVYRRLEPSAPAYTVIASGGGGTHGYHHREPRRLTNRERARLQSFPDWFVFEHGEAYRARSAYPRVRRQIGNAVPPMAARLIVDEVVRSLSEAGIPKRAASQLSRFRGSALHLCGTRQSRQVPS